MECFWGEEMGVIDETQPLLPHQQRHFDILKVHSQQGGLCLILGEPGTGKTVLKNAIIHHNPKQWITPIINRSLHTWPSLLRLLCQAMQVDINGNDHRCETRLIAEARNLTNAAELADVLVREERRHLNTSSDSEVLLNVLASELQRVGTPRITAADVFAAVTALYRRCRGGYAVVAMVVGHGILGFRDPHGIRPLVLGRRDTTKGPEYMLASESVALDMLGFGSVRDIAPGEAVFIDEHGRLNAQQCVATTRHAPCIFEYVYFARPDSIIDNVSVQRARMRMGDRLAEKIRRERPNHGIDVVIPIPDTSRTAALQVAQHLGIKDREGFIKNRYIGRTFIMPGQDQRKKSVRSKLNAIDLEFRNKTVLLVDDSIVRGTTSAQIIEIAREAGARKVYFASAAPPVRHPNVYGIDMPAADELVAAGRTEDEVRAEIGADWLIYQDLEDLINACRHDDSRVYEFDTSCFSGEYVTGDITPEYLDSLQKQRSDGAKAQRRTAGSLKVVRGV